MLEKAQERYEQERAFEKEIRKFGELIKNDTAVLDQLDECPDKDAFCDLYISLAKERGITFSKEDIEIAVQEQKQGQDWIIPRKILLMIVNRF